MSTLLIPPALEVVLQGLHESEIRCGIQNEPPAGGITAWIDYGSRTEKATFYGTSIRLNRPYRGGSSRRCWKSPTRKAKSGTRRRPRLSRGRGSFRNFENAWVGYVRPSQAVEAGSHDAQCRPPEPLGCAAAVEG